MMKVFQLHVSVATLFGMIADSLLCFFAIVLAASSLSIVPGVQAHGELTVPHLLLLASGFALVMSLLYAFVGLYRPTPIAFSAMLRRTLFALVVGAYVTYLAVESMADGSYAGKLMMSALMYLLVGLVVVRGAIFLMRRLATTPRVLIIGTGPEAQSVASDLRVLKRHEREVVGFFPADDAERHLGDTMLGRRVFAREQSIEDIVRENNINEIIVAVREQRGGALPMDQLLACRISGVPVLDLAGFYERAKSEVPIDSLKASWLVYGHGFVQGRGRMIAKRAFDILSSSFLLLIASPVMLLTMIAIRLDSAGPIFYSQERVGLGGKLFMCLKFRSMGTDAEKDGVARWATKNDSRVTRVGAIMRKTRIDELPQLLSVLRGEMSMVGPRPERPSFVKQLKEQIPFYDVRHSIKPGVTGWAQVRYSYGASIDDARKKHQFDLYYVKNNSLLLDLLVLIETVSVVLFREGAH
ncbi:MAG: TIGR03013 family XrtA/PEP-CTERM system glycosyltransferase [Rhizobacter sp.]